jgi:hypothetical protein
VAAKKSKVEYGDFQTPHWFARKVCAFLAAQGITPASVLEPNCGLGHFLLASLEEFGTVRTAVGIEINSTYVESIRQELANNKMVSVEVIQADFFALDWQAVLSRLPDPLLIIGNPPWVTNAGLAVLDSNNLPPKDNFQNQSGIDAITGSSNFDISEWMLLQMVAWVWERPGVVAMLCKTAVARKLLRQLWQTNTSGSTQIRLFDAPHVFDAAVDACLFVYDTSQPATSPFVSSQTCPVYVDFSSDSAVVEIGYRNGRLIANVPLFDRWQHLQSQGEPVYRWRSGIKHDCANVMELQRVNDAYANKLGEMVELEETHLYPMLKSSDIAGAGGSRTPRWMLVTQREVGENTRLMKRFSPRTWEYLENHAEMLDGRKSAIYLRRPRFSIFGVGDYTFSPWKVAISGLYKRLDFVVVGPYEDKPTVLDDTCYFLSCQSEAEANLLADLLNSEPARQFYESLIFWDAKRAITAKILAQLDLFALADELNKRQELEQYGQSLPVPMARQLTFLDI